MGFEIGQGFDMQAALPLDSRSVTATLLTRNAIPAGIRHVGLSVYVISEAKKFALIGGIDNSDWAVDGGGGIDFTGIVNENTPGANLILDPTLGNTIVIVNAGAESISGILPLSSMVLLVNNTVDVLVNNNDLGVTFGARIFTNTGKNFKFKTNTSLLMIYDYFTSAWRIAGGGGGSSDVIVRMVNGSDAVGVDDDVIVADTSGGSVSIGLPDPSFIFKKVTIKKISELNTLTIDPFVFNLDGTTDAIQIFNNNNSVTIVSNGTEYFTL